MDLSNLTPAKGSVKSSKRIGRGQGSGKGGTSTRGHKGAKSRSGYKSKAAFEGGQMPLQRRVPKYGFKNVNRKEYTAMNLGRIQELVDKYKLKTFDLESLRSNNIISKSEKIKVLAHGELSKKIDIEAHAISAKAKETIEALGGTVKMV